MAKGGIGNYNADLNGFVEDNAPSADQLAGWMDVVEAKSNGYQRDIIDALFHLFAESGDYGVAWADIVANLPDTPTLGRTVIRINTNASNEMRLYSYNQEASVWQYIAFT